MDSDGDIPKVFRNGLLRKDTVDSFSRIMGEIEDLERRQNSDYENEYPSPKKGRKSDAARRDEFRNSSGGDTSFESLMEDTPSNYNIPN